MNCTKSICTLIFKKCLLTWTIHWKINKNKDSTMKFCQPQSFHHRLPTTDVQWTECSESNISCYAKHCNVLRQKFNVKLNTVWVSSFLACEAVHRDQGKTSFLVLCRQTFSAKNSTKTPLCINLAFGFELLTDSSSDSHFISCIWHWWVPLAMLTSPEFASSLTHNNSYI